MTLDALLNHSYSGAMENIFTNAKMHELLLYSLECLVDEKKRALLVNFLPMMPGGNVSTSLGKSCFNILAIPLLLKHLAARLL